MENAKQTGIWIDGSKAIIVIFSQGEKHIIEIESDIENHIYHHDEGNKGSFMGTQHLTGERKYEERKKQQLTAYLKKVTEAIDEAAQVYLFGPGETKIHLMKKINSDMRKMTGGLKAVEPADKMTLNQVVAKTRTFFEI